MVTETNKSVNPDGHSTKPAARGAAAGSDKNNNNGTPDSSNTTSIKSSLTSSDGLVNPVSSPKSTGDSGSTPLPGVTSINTEGNADGTAAIFTENSPLLLSARDILNTTSLNATAQVATVGADKNTTTGNNTNNNATKVTSRAGAVPFIPAHLQHHFATSKQSVAPLTAPARPSTNPNTSSTSAAGTSNNTSHPALTSHLSSLFGSKYNLLPYAPEPGSEALYQAEQQALAFAEQQARAHAAAQAQAKALAESYQYPAAKLEASKAAELNRASSSGSGENSASKWCICVHFRVLGCFYLASAVFFCNYDDCIMLLSCCISLTLIFILFYSLFTSSRRGRRGRCRRPLDAVPQSTRAVVGRWAQAETLSGGYGQISLGCHPQQQP